MYPNRLPRPNPSLLSSFEHPHRPALLMQAPRAAQEISPPLPHSTRTHRTSASRLWPEPVLWRQPLGNTQLQTAFEWEDFYFHNSVLNGSLSSRDLVCLDRTCFVDARRRRGGAPPSGAGVRGRHAEHPPALYTGARERRVLAVGGAPVELPPLVPRGVRHPRVGPPPARGWAEPSGGEARADLCPRAAAARGCGCPGGPRRRRRRAVRNANPPATRRPLVCAC